MKRTRFTMRLASEENAEIFFLEEYVRDSFDNDNRFHCLLVPERYAATLRAKIGREPFIISDFGTHLFTTDQPLTQAALREQLAQEFSINCA